MLRTRGLVRLRPGFTYAGIALNLTSKSKKFLSFWKCFHRFFTNLLCVLRCTGQLDFIVNHQHLLPALSMGQAKTLFDVAMGVDDNLLHEDCACRLQ